MIDVLDPTNYLLGELNDKRELVGFDERQETFFFGQVTIKGVTSLIKLKNRTDRNSQVTKIIPLCLHVNTTQKKKIRHCCQIP